MMKLTNLGNIANFLNGKSSPERIEGGEYPVYGANGIIGFSDYYNSEENSIIIGRVGSYCGSLFYSKTRCWITDNSIRCTAKYAS